MVLVRQASDWYSWAVWLWTCSAGLYVSGASGPMKLDRRWQENGGLPGRVGCSSLTQRAQTAGKINGERGASLYGSDVQ
jgi:hypothetical protein